MNFSRDEHIKFEAVQVFDFVYVAVALSMKSIFRFVTPMVEGYACCCCSQQRGLEQSGWISESNCHDD